MLLEKVEKRIEVDYIFLEPQQLLERSRAVVDDLGLREINDPPPVLLKAVAKIRVLEEVIKAFMEQTHGVECIAPKQQTRASEMVRIRADMRVFAVSQKIPEQGILLKERVQPEKPAHQAPKVRKPPVREAALQCAVRVKQFWANGADPRLRVQLAEHQAQRALLEDYIIIQDEHGAPLAHPNRFIVRSRKPEVLLVADHSNAREKASHPLRATVGGRVINDDHLSVETVSRSFGDTRGYTLPQQLWLVASQDADGNL
ncbi:MAG TPA: hypothetical protein VG204_18870 [Terriglobia bacterium]|nr:hypothetical protein [Terriglobia bacterium]